MVEAIWHILLELAPWLFLGVAIAGALHVLVPEDFIRRHLSGKWGVLKAAAVGVPVPLCSCSVIPVGLGLKRQGASDGAVVAFLISTPQSGVESLLISAAFLGWPFTAFSWVSSMVIGLVGGWWTDAVGGGSTTPAVGETGDHCDAPSGGSPLARGVSFAVMLLQTIWFWLVVGIVASAAIEVWVPPGSLSSLAGGGGLAAMLMALVIGMPMYVCSVSSVPIATALVAQGFPPGAALVFLIGGPATNLATMGAVYRTLGGKILAVYLATIAIGSVLCGWLFGFLLAPTATAAAAHEHHAPTWWATASAVALCAMLAWFAVSDALAWLRKRRTSVEAALHKHEAEAPAVAVDVRGMTCEGCVSKLERAITREAGVSGVSVTLEPGRAAARGISVGRLRELVERAGFQVG